MIKSILLTSLFLFSLSARAERGYSVNLKDWPPDISSKILQIAPEMGKKEISPESLNTALKKIDDSFHFNSLKLVKTGNGNELLLLGEISPEVKKINFDGLTDLTDAEALSLMGLNASNLLDENNLKAAVEKLAQYFREQGYRSASVSYEIVSESSIAKVVNFNVNKKEKTKLVDIQLQGLDSEKMTAKIESNLKKNFRYATLNQETLNKISVRMREQLSTNGYYLTQVPSPQISFAANELTARVIFKVTSSKRYYIEVQNTQRFEHTNLEDDVLKLNTYSSKDENMVSDLVEKLKAYYVLQGYPHVNVTTTENKKNNLTYLYLNVDEGPYTQISDFKVVGQYSRTEKFYKDKFYELASPSVQKGIYLKDDIELAAKNLLIYLQNDGFVNAKLSRVFVSTERENPSHGLVVIQLEEGTQVKISQINFVGVSPENLAGVQEAAKLSANQSLSLSQLELSILNIKNYYQSQGYIEYKLLNENTDLMNYSEDNSTASIKFEIAEGPKVEVQSILIDGNTRTKDKLILIELDFKPGDTLNPAKIEESISRLQRTGQFNSVEISTLEKDKPIAQRTVVIKVVERDPGVRVIGVGVTDENKGTLRGYTGVAYRNFFGWGVGLSARADLNYNFALLRYLEQKYTFGFVWPYLFETRARFRTSATRSNTIGDVTINKVTEANTAVFSIEQDFTSHFTGIFSYSVSTYKDHGITNEDEIKYGYSSESLVIGSIGPTIDLDYRDNLFNPTKGSFSRLSGEYATEFLGTNNVDDFYRVTAQTTHYFPYKDSGFVFVQSLQGGYVKDIDSVKNEGIPFDKRGFTLGGRTTVRGFESSEFFPSTTELGASYRLNTSSSYELVKSELRFPISFKYDLSGAVFYDGGRVQIEGVNLIDGWRDAVGVGLRYNTPVGPLNLEYAQKLQKKAGESDGAFHLSVGVF
jgi:outer membrane protein insertion porin family